MEELAPVPIPLNTIRAGFNELGRLVTVALRTQVGDAARLGGVRDDCLRLLALAQQHINVIPLTEYAIIRDSLNNMIRCLDEASQVSSDPPDSHFVPTATVVHTGRPGRPRIEIDPDLLAVGLELRGPTHLAPIFNCHPRTVRRRGLEQGLVEPGEPVYVDYEQEDGSVMRIYRSSTASQSDLPDSELDEIVAYILEAFPSFGRRMIDGHLKHLGHRIPRSRLQASYSRVHGAPASVFGPRRINRRVYSVPGPNSLWHHDGQHGLIRWKIVFHAFVDGFSRLVTGIRASNNNSAQTVLDLFLESVDVHGLPSRVRGDHGTENMLVASYMEAHRGIERGSYIWGRSVHNVRVERLWRDLTTGFGSKWKQFFQNLELYDKLCPDSDDHIWLLHFLFLPAIDSDAIAWAETWNSHVLTIRGERQRSPKDMFVFGMIQNGVRGFDADTEDDEVDDVDTYGIDWDEYNDHAILTHHTAENQPDFQDSDGDLNANPFKAHYPHHLSHVEVEEVCGSLTPQQVDYLQLQLEQLPYFHSQSMDSRRLVWIQALAICDRMFEPS